MIGRTLRVQDLLTRMGRTRERKREEIDGQRTFSVSAVEDKLHPLLPRVIDPPQASSSTRTTSDDSLNEEDDVVPSEEKDGMSKGWNEQMGRETILAVGKEREGNTRENCQSILHVNQLENKS